MGFMIPDPSWSKVLWSQDSCTQPYVLSPPFRSGPLVIPPLGSFHWPSAFWSTSMGLGPSITRKGFKSMSINASWLPKPFLNNTTSTHSCFFDFNFPKDVPMNSFFCSLIIVSEPGERLWSDPSLATGLWGQSLSQSGISGFAWGGLRIRTVFYAQTCFTFEVKWLE